jgi:hypothetical protein
MDLETTQSFAATDAAEIFNERRCRYEAHDQVQCTIGGYVPSHLGLDSIVIGAYREQLHYAARVRAGFVPLTRRQVFERIKSLETTKGPFVILPEKDAGRWGQGLTVEKDEGVQMHASRRGDQSPTLCRKDGTIVPARELHWRCGHFVPLSGSSSARNGSRPGLAPLVPFASVKPYSLRSFFHAHMVHYPPRMSSHGRRQPGAHGRRAGLSVLPWVHYVCTFPVRLRTPCLRSLRRGESADACAFRSGARYPIQGLTARVLKYEDRPPFGRDSSRGIAAHAGSRSAASEYSCSSRRRPWGDGCSAVTAIARTDKLPGCRPQ